MGSTTEFIKQLIGGPSDFGIGWLIILLAALIGIVIAISNGAYFIVAKLREKSRFLDIVSRLDTGAHISYFISLLGTPVSINQTGTEEEYLFVNKYCYVQVITDSNGKASLFSVTTRRGNFSPALKFPYMAHGVTLGHARFSSLGTPGSRIYNGDHGGITFYSESYYYGYDASYRTVFFSFNPNGFGKLGIVPRSWIMGGIPDEKEDMVTKRFREETLVNTYTVSTFIGPDGHKNVNDLTIFGPKSYQVRVFGNG